MEKERMEQIVEGFRSAFEFLTKKSLVISDDAILHIFKDVFEKNFSVSIDGHSFIRSSGVLEFLGAVCKDTGNHSTSVVVCGINICTWLGGSEERFHTYQEAVTGFVSQILEHAQGAGKENVSVVTAVYDCLGKIAGHQPGLRWICNKYKGLISDSFVLLRAGSSVFLEKSVIDYLASLAEGPSHTDYAEELGKIHVHIADNIYQALHKYATSGSGIYGAATTQICSFTRTVLKLTERLFQAKSPVSCQLVSRPGFVPDCVEVFRKSRGQELERCVRILEMLLHQKPGDSSFMMDQAECLWREGEVIKSLKLVTKLCNMVGKPSHCHQMLVAPLHLVTGKGDNNEWTPTLKNQKYSRTKLLDIISTSLSCITRAKLNETRLICEVLETTVDNKADMTSMTSNNSKIQRSCLQYFCDNTGQIDSKVTELLLISTLQMIKQTTIDSVTYSLSLRCIQKNLPLLLQSTQHSGLGADLSNILQRNLCSLQWEIRDTTLEFLEGVIGDYKDSACVLAWLQTYNVPVQVWHCVSDGESYVRASAISALWKVNRCRPLWAALLDNIGHTEVTALGVIESVIASDSEAFARRSAARFLSLYLRAKPSTELTEKVCCQVLPTLLTAATDFDWEVKLCVLEFTDSFIDDHISAEVKVEVPEYARVIQQSSAPCNSQSGDHAGLQAVYKLHSTGSLVSLLTLLEDYDEKVCEKACEAVTRCQQQLVRVLGDQSLTQEYMQASSLLTHNGVDENKCDVTTDFEPTQKRLKPDTEVSNNVEPDERKRLLEFFGTTVYAIMNFDSRGYTAKFNSKRDYYSNPLSLIQDILSYGDKEEEDNLVDCY